MRVRLSGPTLNSGATGVSYAAQVLDAAAHEGHVEIDCAAVDRVTPSAANALVMTLLEGMGEDQFIARVSLTHATEHVKREWAKAVDRYQRGIRLSSQRSA